MTHPYSTVEFGHSLPHIGEPISVPEWGTTLLRRRCGENHYDAIGTYPITVFKRDCDLRGGLDRLASLGLVSAVLVVENTLRPPLPELERAFDFVRPFKAHYVYDRSISAVPYSKHHRYEIRRAARSLRVERFDLADRLDEWNALYQTLVARRGLARTIHDLPALHHETLSRLPGVVSIGAFAEARLVSCHVWVCGDGHAMSHLAASNEQGYAARALYAVNDSSIGVMTECTIFNFGGAAGGTDEASAGLARFKRGFANANAASYLCGTVLAPNVYDELSRVAGAALDGRYFPAYRAPMIPAAGYAMAVQGAPA